MLAAMLAGMPATTRLLPTLPDNRDAIAAAFARHSDCDIIVTSGGASVGDHDLVKPALVHAGGMVDFWRIAMRPGKPVMVARLGETIVLGLPGNPVSAYVTATLLLLPLIRQMAGASSPLPTTMKASAGAAFPATGPRQDFVRAKLHDGALFPLGNQDSGALSALLAAHALVIRAAGSLPAAPGEPLDYLPLA
ncbi:molybdopterin-binding protein, partial [Blastomonas sp.]|uniref:molybdopterin-binding protein n=1 Tax=Blastomonas sp. TaxID=1909299 RepID=UPI0035948A53